MAVTIDRAKITSRDADWMALDQSARAELCTWLEVHGIEPRETTAVERDVVDCALIRATVIALGPDGQPYLEVSGDVSVIEREVIQRSDPPAWWQWP